MFKTTIAGVELNNPVIAASGTFGFGLQYNELFDVSILGGISTKGLTLNPKDGNHGNRIYETCGGILNSVGLENPGVDAFLEKELPEMKNLNTKIIANLGGGNIEEYVEGAIRLNNSEIDMIELNISCPNVKAGGMAFGIKASKAKEVVSEVRKVVTKPLIVKLSPNAENIVELAKECERAGADALSLVNTFKAMAIDINKRCPVFENITAGLSGPAIKPIALRMVYEVSKCVNIPVIGMGGITSFSDAVEYIMAGATAVQVGTANFINPLNIKDIALGLEGYFKENNIENIEEIRGCIWR